MFQEHPILSRVESVPMLGKASPAIRNNWKRNVEELMTGKRKSAGAVGRAGRSKADLGQKEAQLEKTQAELEEASDAQLRHMEGGKNAKAAGQQKAEIRSQQR
jgi:hypothetical protein